MRKIVIANSKGGVAKTTTSVNLGAGLARRGHRTLLIDLDTQGHIARSLGIEPQVTLATVIEEELMPQEAMIEARPNLYVLAGGRELAGTKRLIARRDLGSEMALYEALVPLDGQFEYVLLDTAPSWDVLNINALFYANEILVPVSLEVLALHGVADFIASVKVVQRYNPNIQIRYILPTFLDLRVAKSNEILEQLQRHFNGLVLPPIRYSVRLSEAPGFGQSIFEYAPGSRGALDYEELVERIEKDGA